MDERQHFSGKSGPPRFRTIVSMECSGHSEGHGLTAYSKGTDDAWWLMEIFGLFAASRGYATRCRFEISQDGKVWEVVPPHEAVPDEPAF